MHDPEKIRTDDMPVLPPSVRDISRAPIIIWGVGIAIAVVLIAAFDLEEEEVNVLAMAVLIITFGSAWLYWGTIKSDYTEQKRMQKRQSRARKRRERALRRKKK